MVAMVAMVVRLVSVVWEALAAMGVHRLALAVEAPAVTAGLVVLDRPGWMVPMETSLTPTVQMALMGVLAVWVGLVAQVAPLCLGPLVMVEMVATAV